MGADRGRGYRPDGIARAVHLASHLQFGPLLRALFVGELWMLCAWILIGVAEIVWFAVYMALALLTYWAFDRGLAPLGMLGGAAVVAMLVLRGRVFRGRVLDALTGRKASSRKLMPPEKVATKPFRLHPRRHSVGTDLHTRKGARPV